MSDMRDSSDTGGVSGMDRTSGSLPLPGDAASAGQGGPGEARGPGSAGAPARGDEARTAAVDAALAKLDLRSKVALLGGADMWSVGPEESVGFGRLVMSDGPAGVRGEDWTPEDPSVALPSPTALGATWDTELARRAGLLLAQEARRKGAHIVLAPTVNLHRTPYGGRHFEAYAEDPLLTGVVGAALVAGVQEGGVGTTPKHYVANDSETDRYTVDVQADTRTLRELYLAPFERIVRTARPWGLMAAYNGVDGTTMSEHDVLNNGVLRGEWGFDGALVSDWTGARSTVGCARGGLDLAMPGPDTVYGEHLVAAVRDGRVPEKTVDALARRVLLLAARVGVLENAPAVVPPHALPEPLDGEATVRELAARSFVLLRNESPGRPVLPLDVPGALGAAPHAEGPFADAGSGTVRRIAVSGLPAARPRFGGGGSAQVFPSHVSTPSVRCGPRCPPGSSCPTTPGPTPAHGWPQPPRATASASPRRCTDSTTRSWPPSARPTGACAGWAACPAARPSPTSDGSS